MNAGTQDSKPRKSWSVVVVVSLAIGGVIGILAANAPNPPSTADRIKQGCAREFTLESDRRQCEITLMTKEYQRIQREKMERAGR
jgi:hypothetical protein